MKRSIRYTHLYLQTYYQAKSAKDMVLLPDLQLALSNFGFRHQFSTHNFHRHG